MRPRIPARCILTSLFACLVLSVPHGLSARTFHVTPEGDDNARPLQDARFKTPVAAVAFLAPGDTLLLHEGVYPGGFHVVVRANPDKPVVIRGLSLDAVIGGSGVERDGIRIERSSWVRLENLTIRGANRAGCGVRHSDNVTVTGCLFADNGVWGIFTSFADNIVFEYNECRGSKKEHGIYHSNSGDGFIIRGNRVHGNSGNGIHMNGDPNIPGGDGVLNDGLVEDNIIWGNGRSGGAGINMTHVQDVIVRNNLLHHNLAGGITVYQDHGTFGQASKRVLITGNTVFFARDQGRTGVNVQTTSSHVAVIGNIFVSGGRRGAVEFNARHLGSVYSDRNVYWGVPDSVVIEQRSRRLSLEDWRVRTSNDRFSVVANPRFVNPEAGDFRLSPGSPAIDLGSGVEEIVRVLERIGDFGLTVERLSALPRRDLDGDPRPNGTAPDAGAFEFR